MTADPFLIERATYHRPSVEAVLPLINIVFLLLIFFLAAGSLSSPLDKSIEAPIQTVEFESVESLPADWLYLHADGGLTFQEYNLSKEDISSTLTERNGTLFADRNVKGKVLSEVLKAYEQAGAENVLLLTEKDGGGFE